ncbi:response regulator [Desertivirga xinjiangensis]|uniref:response regulator n=1 Tax=Desertivirga xinjiangensis TaxID=539206 RepID=UPI00210AE0E6|nr:response regulator [Pedobacter xinjiangensis]
MEINNFSYHKVMVVDDAKIDRFLAEKVISKYSFAEEVVSVESAISALDYLSTNTGDEEALPDLIFLDINMPEMNGFEFLAEYNKLPENIKKKCIIIMLSSSLHPEDKELALQSPYVCQFLNKPLTEQKLIEITSI